MFHKGSCYQPGEGRGPSWSKQLTGKETYKLNSTSASKPNCRDCGDDGGLQEENRWLNFEVCEEIRKIMCIF